MFQKIGSLGRFGGPLVVDRIVTNSVTIAIGDSVKTASGFAALGTAGARVLGHVVGLVGKDGLSPVKDGTFLNNPGEAYTVASDNQTVAQVRAIVEVSQDALYAAEIDATAGTTTGSDLAGYNFDLVDEDTLDESTAAQTVAQYYSHGLNGSSTDTVVANIIESEVFGF
jgi:hypothetical protein